jgi:hypothetical protein
MRFSISAGAVACVALALAPAARAADKAAVDRAVDRAVAYLKSTQQADGTWRYQHTGPGPAPGSVADTTVGATALAGLALLEGGVAPEDPAIQKAVRVVRDASTDCTFTYSLSLMVMFLDRLGDPADVPLIESLAVRLLAGQDPATGGWSYDCPPLPRDEVRRLQALPRGESPLRRPPAGEPNGRRGANDLSPEIRGQLRQLEQHQGLGRGSVEGGDNSNTQFAILALWIARRQGIPVDTAMKRIDSRFHTTQNNDGGWGYFLKSVVMPGPRGGGPNVANASGSTPSMTCAGLLGLALSHGSALETTLRAGGPAGAVPVPHRPVADFGRDPAVRKGLGSLGSSLVAGRAAPARPLPGRPGVGLAPDPRNTNTEYYFLFSLERVAVAYGLETIGGKNWYDYGAAILLRSQEPDGSWIGEFAQGGCDTSFGILFLRRANLARDLTATLGKVEDVVLRGGVNLDALKGAGPENPNAPPAEGPRPGSGAPAPAEPRPTPPPVAVPVPDSRPAAAPAENAAVRIGEELVQASRLRQDAVLAKLRDTKGPVYTDALAYAIHKLTGPAKTKARDALADRLTRMSAKTLTEKLQDDDVEVRRAAALAVAMKDDRTNIPRLIELLNDPEVPVAHAAHAALKDLTRQDFGPGPEATRDEVAQAVGAWKDWWNKNGDK